MEQLNDLLSIFEKQFSYKFESEQVEELKVSLNLEDSSVQNTLFSLANFLKPKKVGLPQIGDHVVAMWGQSAYRRVICKRKLLVSA